MYDESSIMAGVDSLLGTQSVASQVRCVPMLQFTDDFRKLSWNVAMG